MNHREEADTMGTVLVPEDAYYGAQTQRAVENFSLSGLRLPLSFIRTLGTIEKHAAAQIIGYDKSAAIAKEAFAKGKTVREVAVENNVLPEAELGKILDKVVYGE
jgi:fumarate hydratase class II